jgi:hypothetical protein
MLVGVGPDAVELDAFRDEAAAEILAPVAGMDHAGHRDLAVDGEHPVRGGQGVTPDEQTGHLGHRGVGERGEILEGGPRAAW